MVAIKSKPMKRRTFLRSSTLGVSVVVGLPTLEAMLNESGDALAQGVPLPTRFITWFFGAGFDIDLFEPRAPSGSPINTADPLSPHLRHFGGLEDYVTICSGLGIPATAAGDPHHTGRTSRLSGYQKAVGSSFTNSGWGGPTLDQEIADLIAASSSPTLIPSIQLGVSKIGASDVGDTGTTADFLSMKRGSGGALVGLPADRNPQSIWSAMFSTSGVPQSKSMLDFVIDDLNRITPGLGAFDRSRMEAHLSAIRQAEQRLTSVCNGAPPQPTLTNTELAGQEKITEVSDLMADMLALAFECDLTRVASVEFTKIAPDVQFWQAPGVSAGTQHHVQSHREVSDQYIAGIDYTILQLSNWLFRLKGVTRAGTPVGLTNFLDSTILYATSDVGWGSTHTQDRVPMILAGRGRKNGTPYLKPGMSYIPPGAELGPTDMRIARLKTDPPVPVAGNSSDVLLTCLRCFDPAVDRTTPSSVGDHKNTPPPANPMGATGVGIDALIDPSQV